MKNFVNPKKIKGQDKLDRIKDLMGKMNTLNESTSTSEIENVKKGANGVIYGIIRENQNYFIKTTEKTSGNIMAEDFNYIGGLQNKNLERYKSYAEAMKHLNLKFDMLNESFGVKENNNLFESDVIEVKEANASGVVVKEDPEIIEDQKKVIKVDAPAPVAVEDEVEEEEISSEDDPFADDEEGGEVDMEVDVEEEGEDEGDGYTKKIQKLTGKIGQMLRDKDEPDAELDKYVINSIISAINWEDIPDEDVEDIIAKIEGEDEEDGELEGGDEETLDIDVEEEGGEDPFAEEGDELAEGEEKDKEEHEKMDKDEDKEDEEELSNEDLEEKLKHHEDAIKNIKKEIADLHKDEKEDEEDKEEEEKEKVDEQTSSGRHIVKMIEKNAYCQKHFGKDYKDCTKEQQKQCDDHCGKLGKKVDEGNKFSGERQKAIDAGEDEFEVDGKTYKVEESKKFTKKQLMENFLKKNINNSLNKILKEQSEQSLEEYSQIDMLAGDDVGIAEQNMDIVDAIATGQNYLQASGDLDRDGDQIPNRLDMDSNMDGDLDHETFDGHNQFKEIDVDALLADNPAPTVEPGIKEPTTKPGKKKPRWKKIPKPNVNPKPKAKIAERKKVTTKRNGMYR